MTDNEIIELYMRRDERAIAATQTIYGKYCEKIARNILGDEQEARECANDTFLKAWENIPPENPQSLAAYLANGDDLGIRSNRQRYFRKLLPLQQRGFRNYILYSLV